MSSPSNTRKPKVLLDSSALFAAVYSKIGAARVILRLGEAGLLDLLASPQILAETESALQRKAPESLGYSALLLDRARCTMVNNPSYEEVEALLHIISYPPDTTVLAAAVSARADYLVTLDRQHFLNNLTLMATSLLPVGTPGDFLAWFRSELATWQP